jgi:putative endonuclease
MTVAQQTGSAAEQAACQYLIKKGLRLIARNYRCKVGEIDLIMQDDAALVFVEVRYRENYFYGTSAETVTYAKQKKIIRCAQFYLQQQRIEDMECRFDVMAITSKQGQLAIEWIRDAFSL